MGKIKKYIRSIRWTIIAIVGVIFLGGIVLGTSLSRVVNGIGKTSNVSAPDCIRQPGYKFIDPLLICGVNTTKESDKFKQLQNKLEINIFDTLNNPSITTVSIYFRDLTTGRWTGIDEDATYDPASLIKVPIMIAYYKEAESSPSILQDQIFYPSGVASDFVTLTPNRYYSADQLITAMIANSDNGAVPLLLRHIDQNALREIFNELGIPFFGDPNTPRYQISAKVYGLFFRILYNGTYLTKEDSERALELLSRSTFNDGMVAGVPQDITVAHKFGEYASKDKSGNQIGSEELHDCGIVYHPDHPYLLCVMTKGNDLGFLTKMVQQVSQIVYQEVSNNYQ